jgi:type II secretion system protein D
VKPGLPLGQTQIITDINEPKLSGNALSGLYRVYTGRRVIVSAAAAVAEFSFVQEATPQEPLTYAEAAELLKKAATIEGFVFVPDAENPNLDILTHTSGIRPTNRGVSVYNENDTLPEGDAVISYVMTLSYIKPAEAVNTFTQIIGQFGAYGSIAAVANASAVVITENTSLIRKLIDLKKEIDKPGSVQGTRFIKVQFADVTEIAETLTALLTAQQSTQKTAGIQRADAAPAAPTAPPGVIPQTGGSSAGGAGEDTPVQIIPDPRTNRIFVMGRPVDLLFVEGLVREFDVETSEKNFLRRKLRFLTVSDFLPIAGDALTRAFSGTGDSGGSGGGASGGPQSGASRAQSTGGQTSSSSRSSGSRSGSSRSNSTGANFGGSSSGGSFGGGGSSGGFGGGGGGSGGGGLGDPDVSSAPESVLVGRTLLVADNITNSIVVQGPPSGLEIIERLLDQIDVKPDQVMISTVIGQMALNNSKESGVNYLFNSSDFKLGGGGNNSPVIPLPEVPALGDYLFPAFNPASLSGSGLRAIGTIGDLGVYLKALQSKTDFTVLSRPSIFTSNNQKGTISSGERIAIPTQGGTSGGNYNTGTSIEYQDVVLRLEVIPLVNSDNEITMQISLLNDEQNGTQVIAGAGTNGGDLEVPRITTREVLTTATVPNGQTIVLGGLIVGKNDKTKSGIPILSDIPYLGRLFSTTVDKDDRSELMVFIQPSIVKSDRSLDAVQADMDNRYKVSGKAREFSDGPGVLPPVDAIPVSDKVGTRAPEPQAPAAASTLKPSIRPAFRR